MTALLAGDVTGVQVAVILAAAAAGVGLVWVVLWHACTFGLPGVVPLQDDGPALDGRRRRWLGKHRKELIVATHSPDCCRPGAAVAEHLYEDDEAHAMQERRQIRLRRKVSHRQRRLLLKLRRQAEDLLARQLIGGLR